MDCCKTSRAKGAIKQNFQHRWSTSRRACPSCPAWTTSWRAASPASRRLARPPGHMDNVPGSHPCLVFLKVMQAGVCRESNTEPSIELCRVRACCQCMSRRAGLSGGRSQWWQRNLASKRRGWQALGEEEALRPTHRLDACTAGLVVLGRTAAFVAGFNKLLAAAGPPRAVRKIYRALSAAPPPLGALLSYPATPLPTPQQPHHPPYHPCALPGHRDLSVR